jgi:transposase
MRKTYPSDISREQFEQVKDLLETARKKTRPRTVDLYDVFCAILYLLKSGCQWRMLPSDFPKWRTVHHYFSLWSTAPENGVSLLERALKKSGWRGSTKTGTQRQDELLHR